MNLYKEQSGMRTQTTQTTPEYKFIKAVIKYLLSAKNHEELLPRRFLIILELQHRRFLIVHMLQLD